MRKIQEHISCYMMRSEIQGEILSQMLQQMSLFLANTNGKILLLIVAKMHRSLTAVAVLGGHGGHCPRPRAFHNPKGAPRLRKIEKKSQENM